MAGAGDQGSRNTVDDIKHQNFKTHRSDSQQNEVLTKEKKLARR